MTVRIVPFPSCLFEAFEVQYVAPRQTAQMEGRRTETATTGQGYWRGSFQTPFLTTEQLAELDAFALDMQVPGAVFPVFDPERPRPRSTLIALANGGISAFASPTAPVIGGLPPGFLLQRGDRIGLLIGTTVRSLHMVMDDIVANTQGASTLRVEPAIDTQIFTSFNTTVVFEKPTCLMQMDPGFSMGKGAGERRASFTATEVFFS